MTDLQDNPAPAGSAPPPVPLTAGRYALFETPEGGAVLAWTPDGGQPAQHLIPAALWRLMRAAANGESVTPAAVMKAMLGRGG